jgi:hypothetical protein
MLHIDQSATGIEVLEGDFEPVAPPRRATADREQVLTCGVSS